MKTYIFVVLISLISSPAFAVEWPLINAHVHCIHGAWDVLPSKKAIKNGHLIY
jgi:hypothetical protein